MQQIASPISQKEVETRTTLVGLDGRVVQRPDGSRLLVDAYNVLHRDYDDIFTERNSLKEECERLKAELNTAQAHRTNTAEAESRLQTLGDDNARVVDEISRRKSEDLLHIAVICQIRGSLGDLTKRLFKSAADEIENQSSYSSQHKDPFAMSDISTVTLNEELQLLQQVKDRLFLVLSTAASSTRQLETNVQNLEMSSKRLEGESAVLTEGSQILLLESDQRTKIGNDREEEYIELLSIMFSDRAVVVKPPRVSTSTDCEGLGHVRPSHVDSVSTNDQHPVSSPQPTKSVIVDSLRLSTYNRDVDTADTSATVDRRHSVNRGALTSCEIQSYNTAEKDQQRTGVLISDNAKKSRYSLSEIKAPSKDKRSMSKKRKTSHNGTDGTNGASSPRKEDKECGIIIEVGGKVLSSTSDCFQLGDIIMSGDGKTVITQQDLSSIVSSSTSGIISVRVRRNGTMRTVDFKSRKSKKKPRASQQPDNPPTPQPRSVHSRMKHLRQK